jgi:endonuclease YncB( thermonuclease family)
VSRRVRIRQVTAPIVAALLVLPGLAHAATSRTLVAKVERVNDGDTLTALKSDGTKLRIRLLGIDAPEIPHGTKPGQPYGDEARDYLARLIGGRTIRAKSYGPDGSNGILALVFLGAVNVNVEMVQQGLAELYRGAPCKTYCRDLRIAELRARQDRVGMWAQGDKYQSPATFRRRHRNPGD